MSYTVKIKVEMKASCFESLYQSFRKLNWLIVPLDEYRFIATSSKSGSRITGILVKEDDRIDLSTDSDYTREIEKELGVQLNLLKQEYTCQVLETDINSQGGYITRTVDAEQNVCIEAYLS